MCTPTTPAQLLARSRRWCAGWAASVVAATALLALFLHPTSPLLTPALVALQLAIVAFVLTILDAAAAGGRPQPRTSVAAFLAVASAAAAGASGGVSGITSLMFALAGWPGERIDLVGGILLVVGVGAAAVALSAWLVVGALRRYAARMRLQPDERFFAFLAGLVAMGIAFLVLLRL